MHIKYLKGTYSAHFRVQIFTLTLELLCMSSKHFLIIMGPDATPQVILRLVHTVLRSYHLQPSFFRLVAPHKQKA